ncbi:MAG: hypothetical protein LBU42_03410 [Prevotellaceae bacterium]|jgi:hypothetical protein|nr:hypothetical protein [Prevotellaceae bacterium]
MKTIIFFFAMAVSIAMTATQPEPPVYYTGNNEPAASSVDSLQLAVSNKMPECPLYYTGNNEPAASVVSVYNEY